MIESHKNLILNLAEESDKANEPHSALLSFGPLELAGWNGEPVNLNKKKEAQKPQRILDRRKSANPSPRAEISVTRKTELSTPRQRKRFPIINPKMLVPKVHIVQAPFQSNFFLKNQTESNQTCKITLKNPESRYIKRSLHSDIIKQSDLLQNYYTLKLVHRNFELSTDHSRNNKGRAPHNVHSSMG